MENPFHHPIPKDTKLIETFGRQNGTFLRLEQHLARMAQSAAAFGISFDQGLAMRCLEKLPKHGDLRCRLTLDMAGFFNATFAPFTPSRTPWVLALSQHKLRSSDPWLAHKSTQRALYDAARAALPTGVDEIIFQNTDGQICEGAITNIFIRPHASDKMLHTPPLCCGVLPGVLRQHLLGTHKAQERALNLKDLHDADAIFVGNALRGLIAARLT